MTKDATIYLVDVEITTSTRFSVFWKILYLERHSLLDTLGQTQASIVKPFVLVGQEKQSKTPDPDTQTNAQSVDRATDFRRALT